MTKKSIIKTVASIEELSPSKAEWAGYYAGPNGEKKLLGAKSFGGDEDIFKYFIDAIVYLYSIDEDKEKIYNNISYVKGKIDLKKSDLSETLYLILLLKLEELYAVLKSESFFFYNTRIENLSKVKGQINFAKSLQVNKGLLHKNVCTYRNITFDHPLLALIKEFFLYFSKQINNSTFGSSVNNKKLIQMASHVSVIFSESRKLSSYTDECLKICSRKYDDDGRFSKLIKPLKYLASFYLDNHSFYTLDENKQLPAAEGLVFNLNRPFELVIKKSMQAVSNDAFFPNLDSFTHVRYFEQGSDTALTKLNKRGKSIMVKNNLLPDCWFKIKEKVVILDVKHKVFKGNHFINNSNVKNDSRINRSDLFQIISYMRMHPDNSNKLNKENENIYGLVALEQDSRFIDNFGHYVVSEAIDAKFFSKDINIFKNKENYKIKVVTVRFSQFLSDLGEWINYQEQSSTDDFAFNYEGLFKEFGIQLSSQLGINVGNTDYSSDDVLSSVNEMIDSKTDSLLRFKSYDELKIEFFKINCIVDIKNNKDFIKSLATLIPHAFPFDVKNWIENGNYDELHKEVIDTLKNHIICKEVRKIKIV